MIKEENHMEVLKVDNITMQFGGLTAVKDFDLSLNEGEIIALIGPNGAGKTTAFNMITGVYTPTKGTIWYGEKVINGLKPDIITKKGIARTFQNIRLFKNLTVFENVLIANHLRVKENFLEAIALKAVPGTRAYEEEKEMRARTSDLLKRVGLLELKNEKANSLPYGKQRRLEIARALATNPKILLLDEPAAGMNPKETKELSTFIKEIRDEFKLTIFMIEHHMHLVMDISDRIYVLDHGITIAEGSPHEIQNNPKVIEAYLGVKEDA